MRFLLQLSNQTYLQIFHNKGISVGFWIYTLFLQLYPRWKRWKEMSLLEEYRIRRDTADTTAKLREATITHASQASFSVIFNRVYWSRYVRGRDRRLLRPVRTKSATRRVHKRYERTLPAVVVQRSYSPHSISTVCGQYCVAFISNFWCVV